MDSGKHDLFVTGAGELSDLLHYLSQFHAASETARCWNDAIGAGIVAAFLNFQKCPRMPGKRASADHRNTALAFDIAHGHSSVSRRIVRDKTHQIIQSIEADDIIDPR